ncbi:MAG: peptidylprolyl isomerase [Spirochaetaceae bacterium]|jgi:FKBP-type peptidyl-prolyl cis-trans isomerase SlyD|nr:peptidylprolyl isomerase [Spirochaetaceae bacterium]
MLIAKDRVASFDYTLSGTDKAVIDSSEHTGPLFYLHGHNNIIPGLEKALEGKSEGDRFSVMIPAADAYGERDENLVISVSPDHFPGNIQVQTGMQFEAETSGGSCMVTVTGVSETEVMVDANHPMAGLDLGFDVQVRSVREALPAEIEHGHPHEAGQGCDAACGAEGCGACTGCGGGCGESTASGQPGIDRQE